MARRRQSKYTGLVGLILVLVVIRGCFSGKHDGPAQPVAEVPQHESPAPVSAVPLVSAPAVVRPGPAVEPVSPEAKRKPDSNADPAQDTAPAVRLPKGPVAGPPRATSLLLAADNLAKSGKKAAAIGFYESVVKEYFGTTQAETSSARIRTLGGKVPVVAESERWTPQREIERYPVVAPRTTARTEARTSISESPRYDPPPISPAYGPDYSSSSYPGGKTVQVRGYYRKNGTYVQPHSRRAPRR